MTTVPLYVVFLLWFSGFSLGLFSGLILGLFLAESKNRSDLDAHRLLSVSAFDSIKATSVEEKVRAEHMRAQSAVEVQSLRDALSEAPLPTTFVDSLSEEAPSRRMVRTKDGRELQEIFGDDVI